MKPSTLIDILEQRIAKTPEGIAFGCPGVIGPQRELSWAAFYGLIQKTSSAFQELGLRRADVLVIMAPNSLAWEVCHFAALMRGAAVAGISPHAAPPDVISLVRSLRARHVLVTDLASAASLKTVLPPSCQAILWADIESAPAQGRVINESRAHDIAAFVSTSGTTGSPKLIAYRQEQVLAAVRAIGRALILTPHDRLPCWLPLSNLFQRIVDLWVMDYGARTDFIEDPTRLFEFLPRLKPTVIVGVPRFFEKCIERGQDNIVRLLGGAVRFAVSGSAPLSVAARAAFEGCHVPLLEAYGVSENVIPIALNRLSAYRPGSVGRVLPPNELKLAPDGEIWVRGPGVTEAYWGTSARLSDAENFYATGDLGRFDSKGYLFLEGRKAEIIKNSSGRQISPSRVEAAYRSIPAIREIVVVGHGQAFLVALVTLDPRSLGDTPPGLWRETFRKELTEAEAALAFYERVSQFALLPEPLSVENGELTENGKLKRRAIAERHRTLIESVYRRAA